MSPNQVDGLADYSSLTSVLTNSKLQVINNPAYQVIKGLIGGAQKSNDFLTQQFKDANGNITSVQAGLQSTLDALSSVNAEVSAILTTIATIQANITTIFATLLDRNSSIYGASAYNSGTQTLTSAVQSVMVLNSDVFGSMRAGNTLVAPVAAEYLISGQVEFAASGVGARKVNISSSGGISVNVGLAIGMGGDDTVISFAILVSLGTGESVQANLTQDSGGNLAAQGALQMFRVSYV